MSVTIMDILENAEYYLEGDGRMWPIAKDQLHNTVTLLNKGYGLYDTVDVDFLVRQCGSIEDVPDKEDADV